MKYQRFSIFFLVLLGGIFLLQAQSNEVLDQILKHEKLEFGDLAYLALASNPELPLPESTDAAASQFSTVYKGIEKKASQDSVNLGDFCYVMMQAYNIKGGILYTLFPSQRYAIREMLYLGFIKNPSWPGKEISGEYALRILGNILDWKENQK